MFLHDRFWVTVAHLLSPVKLITTNNDADGANPLQNVERTFQLTRADMALLDNEEYEVQAWCILLNDKVPFRMQWPLFADLKVNGIPVRTVKRPGSQLLGANGRDDGPMEDVEDDHVFGARGDLDGVPIYDKFEEEFGEDEEKGGLILSINEPFLTPLEDSGQVLEASHNVEGRYDFEIDNDDYF
ncbi:hypothetical protein RHMOL_Rhmol03G0142400 [Rhododendron molle]|uniref:Uncharacterized protein n=1 Tax=Rhododendron molle TaxID=49168 RepID=A0ACC0PFR5_RHOML|nr:hypothetical protein RHMOL_Rhmol03G0142400 [Rhododendron molle]